MTKASLSTTFSLFCLVLLLQACTTAPYSSRPLPTSKSGPAPKYALIGGDLISISPSEIRIKTAGREEVYPINAQTRYLDENQLEIPPSGFAPGDSIAIRADIGGKAPVDWVKKGASVKIRFP